MSSLPSVNLAADSLDDPKTRLVLSTYNRRGQMVVLDLSHLVAGVLRAAGTPQSLGTARDLAKYIPEA